MSGKTCFDANGARLARNPAKPDGEAGTPEYDNKYFLGINQNAGYWFFYEKQKLTTLDYDFLKTMKHKADVYVIYADVCVLPELFCTEHHIYFKKIPRDIRQF